MSSLIKMGLAQRAIRKIKRLFLRIGDKRLHRTISILDNSRKKIFRIYDFGELCRYRASSFWIKEPETIEWIDSFSKEDTLLDIGANIGIYSLYAASKGIKCICIEPDALNFALLNMNISANRFGGLIQAYLIALHDKSGLSTLNLQKMQWGGALSSFDNTSDQFEKSFIADHSQGCYGDRLDHCVDNLRQDITHIKIDVDGNENLILKGAIRSLKTLPLKSLLIELDESRSDYSSSLQILNDCGFELVKKTHAPIFDNSRFSSTSNHIFLKKA